MKKKKFFHINNLDKSSTVKNSLDNEVHNLNNIYNQNIEKLKKDYLSNLEQINIININYITQSFLFIKEQTELMNSWRNHPEKTENISQLQSYFFNQQNLILSWQIQTEKDYQQLASISPLHIPADKHNIGGSNKTNPYDEILSPYANNTSSTYKPTKI